MSQDTNMSTDKNEALRARMADALIAAGLAYRSQFDGHLCAGRLGDSEIDSDDLDRMASSLSAPASGTAGEAVAWLHTIQQGGGEHDQALSFAPDNFPLGDELGFRSLGVVPLFAQPPSDTEPFGWYLAEDWNGWRKGYTFRTRPTGSATNTAPFIPLYARSDEAFTIGMEMAAWSERLSGPHDSRKVRQLLAGWAERLQTITPPSASPSAPASACCVEDGELAIDDDGQPKCPKCGAGLILACQASAPASAGAVDEWQPIESAPHGRKVIAGYTNRAGNWRTIVATFHEAGTLQCDPDYMDNADDDGYAPAGWYETCEAMEVTHPTEEPPTHWRPLPAPPAIDASRTPEIAK